MFQFRKAKNPGQTPPVPSSTDDWLPNGHLAWFVHDAVESLDIDKLLGDLPFGKDAVLCPPRVMLRLLIYAYCTGTYSSRRIAANIKVSIAFRVLAGGHAPDHRTICRFREEWPDEFNRAFVQVVDIAREAKLVKMGTIAIDRSKVEAISSEHKAMSDDWMLMEEQRLRGEIAKLTRAAKKQDELEDYASARTMRARILALPR